MDRDTATPRNLLAILAAYLPPHAPFTRQEADALGMLPSDTRVLRRGQNIIVQSRRHDSVYLLDFGFASRYKVLSDGKRQVFHIALPGDVLGYPTCFFEQALYTISALTDVRLHAVSFANLAELLAACPRLAMALLSWSAKEAAIHVEHLTTVGRRSSAEKVAHFLLEMGVRLRAIGIGDGATYVMPLTQEQIADQLGLSTPHISRTLRRLREDGLIELQGSQIQLVDRKALGTLADFDDSYLASFNLSSHAQPSVSLPTDPVTHQGEQHAADRQSF